MIKTLEFPDKKIILLGTAHVSQESIKEVAHEIENQMPDCVAVELDEGRLKSLNNPDSWQNLDIVQVLKQKKGFLLLANLVLSSFQKRMGKGLGVKPGDEMRSAIDAAKKFQIPAKMVDRPIQITLRRAWAKNSLWGKCKLLSALISSAFSKEKISSEEIENLKTESEMDSMMAELSQFLPAVKEVLIDERDKYLASEIWKCANNLKIEKENSVNFESEENLKNQIPRKKTILAVLGAGHLAGVEKRILAISNGSETCENDSILKVPPKKFGTKIFAWLIPLLIATFIALGFYFGGREKGAGMIGAWLIWNGALAGLFTIFAGGCLPAILVSMIFAPFTSLCPFVGVGMFSALTQAIVKKPKVSDMETLQDDVASFKGFYKNRVLRVLLVFAFSSLGSSIGTFVAGASFATTIAKFFDKILCAFKK